MSEITEKMDRPAHADPPSLRELKELPEWDDLLLLRGYLEREDVEGARSFVRELEERWPESERVRHYAKVLAPPVVRVVPGGPYRSLKRELKWLQEHPNDYPGRWIAVHGDSVIAVGASPGEVLEAVRQIPGCTDALLNLQAGSPAEKRNDLLRLC